MEFQRSDDLHYPWWLALASASGLLSYLLSPILTLYPPALPVTAALPVWLRDLRREYLAGGVYDAGSG